MTGGGNSEFMLPQVDKLELPQGGVVLGLSGGRDSVALLRLLLLRGARVFACHVHHGIRGTAADEDAEFCRRLCEKFGVPFEEYRLDVPQLARENGTSLETEARLWRWRTTRTTRRRRRSSICAAGPRGREVCRRCMAAATGSPGGDPC